MLPCSVHPLNTEAGCTAGADRETPFKISYSKSIVLENREQKKNLMGFVYSFFNSKSLVNCFSETINILKHLPQKKIRDYQRLMYIAPSSDLLC